MNDRSPRLRALAPWLALLGVLLQTAGFLFHLARADGRVPAIVLASMGSLFLLAFAWIELASLTRFVRSRAFRFGGSELFGVALTLSLLVGLNFLGARHGRRWDLTQTRFFTLSETTRSVLSTLHGPLRIQAFFEPAGERYVKMKDLESLFTGASKHLSFEFVNPYKNPAAVKRAGIRRADSILVEHETRRQIITECTEEALTNAILKVSRPERSVVYLLQGHGAPAVEDRDRNGLDRLRKSLEALQMELRPLTFQTRSEVPDDARALIAGFFETPLLPAEREAIHRYHARGGALLFLLDPGQDSGLEDWIRKTWGVQVCDDVVVDQMSQVFGGDYFMPMVSSYPRHPITEDFRIATFFPTARSLLALPRQPRGVRLTALCQTGPKAWAESQPRATVVDFDPAQDRRGPICVAMAATAPTTAPPHGGTGKAPEARFVLFGDSDFARNQRFDFQGNGSLLTKAISWVSGDDVLVHIEGKSMGNRTLLLSKRDGVFVFYLTVLVWPGLFFLMALFMAYRRRPEE